MSDDYGQTGECNYYIAKEVIWSAAMAFAFPKGSHITAHFNKWYIASCGFIMNFLQMYII